MDDNFSEISYQSDSKSIQHQKNLNPNKRDANRLELESKYSSEFSEAHSNSNDSVQRNLNPNPKYKFESDCDSLGSQCFSDNGKPVDFKLRAGSSDEENIQKKLPLNKSSSLQSKFFRENLKNPKNFEDKSNGLAPLLESEEDGETTKRVSSSPDINSLLRDDNNMNFEENLRKNSMENNVMKQSLRDFEKHMSENKIFNKIEKKDEVVEEKNEKEIGKIEEENDKEFMEKDYKIRESNLDTRASFQINESIGY